MEMLKQNLVRLCEITGEASQAAIAEKCGLETASLNRYITGGTRFSLKALLSICSQYGFTLDEFVYDNLLEKKAARLRREMEAVAYEMYEGSYLAYLRAAANDKLKYGVICLYCRTDETCGPLKTRLIGEFFNDLGDAVQRKRAVDAVWDKRNSTFQSIEAVFSNPANRYRGEFQIAGGTISLQLSDDYDDHVLILLPDSRKKRQYIGGVGTLNSIVKIGEGKHTLPCAQKILLSRRELTVEEEDLYDVLSIDFFPGTLDIDADWLGLAKKMLALTENFIQGTERTGLTEDDLLLVVATNLANACKQHLYANRLPYFVVTYKDDVKAYELIKESPVKG